MSAEIGPHGRPDLVISGKTCLSALEKAQIKFVRRTFEPGLIDRCVRFGQRQFGQAWIHHCTKHLRQAHGLERLPAWDPQQSYILVANHRSFFDLYVVTAHLVRAGLPQRIIFPVRSKFFYDNPAGLLVNGIMSFFAMYPPLFRERSKAALNLKSLSELAWLLRRGGVLAGIHPEGTRKQDDDPYSFLPAQRGVGKIICEARTNVIPVFVNGLINDLPQQIKSNFERSGIPIFIVFGKPIDFSDLFALPQTAKVEQAAADRAMTAIAALGQEEKLLRAAGARPPSP